VDGQAPLGSFDAEVAIKQASSSGKENFGDASNVIIPEVHLHQDEYHSDFLYAEFKGINIKGIDCTRPAIRFKRIRLG
jgi:hypothetical protein